MQGIEQVREIRLRTTVYFGVGASARLPDVFAELARSGVRSILAVTGRSAYQCVWPAVCEAAQAAGMVLSHCDSIRPNPQTDQVDEAVRIGAAARAQAVIGIGGGSSIDSAKAAAVLLANPGHSARELFENRFAPSAPVPVIAVNLTHGTGTEVNGAAVCTVPQTHRKSSMKAIRCYPAVAIDDPALMLGMSADQIRWTSIDALNHAFEAATSSRADCWSFPLACEAVQLVARHLPFALRNPQDLEHRSWLAYAAMIAGAAFDHAGLHVTHAMVRPVSALRPDVAHGLGLAMLFPAAAAACWRASPRLCCQVLSPLVSGLEGVPQEAPVVELALASWVRSMGVTQTLGDFFDRENPPLEDMLDQALSKPMPNAPMPVSRDILRALFVRCLRAPSGAGRPAC